MSQLDAFLKFLRIKKMHLKHKKVDGTVDAPTGTIWGLAKPGDGTTGSHGERLPNPPMVKYFGAGPKDIKFCNGKGYLTVFDHFKGKYNLKVSLHPHARLVKPGTPLRNGSYIQLPTPRNHTVHDQSNISGLVDQLANMQQP